MKFWFWKLSTSLGVFLAITPEREREREREENSSLSFNTRGNGPAFIVSSDRCTPGPGACLAALSSRVLASLQEMR